MKAFKRKVYDTHDGIKFSKDKFDNIRKKLILFNTVDILQQNKIISEFIELAESSEPDELDKVYFLLLKFVELAMSDNISKFVSSKILKYFMQKTAVTRKGCGSSWRVLFKTYCFNHRYESHTLSANNKYCI